MLRLSEHARAAVPNRQFLIAVAAVIVLLSIAGIEEIVTGHVPDFLPRWQMGVFLALAWVCSAIQLVRFGLKSFRWSGGVFLAAYTAFLGSSAWPNPPHVVVVTGSVGTFVVILFGLAPFVTVTKRNTGTTVESAPGIPVE